jgi:hypothetical protein
MDNVVKFPEANYGTELIGPFNEPFYAVTSDGYKIPNLKALVRENGEDIFLVFDDRFGIDTTKPELQRWAGFIGQVMAVSAGFCSFGENSAPDINRFKCQMTSLNEVP